MSLCLLVQVNILQIETETEGVKKVAEGEGRNPVLHNKINEVDEPRCFSTSAPLLPEARSLFSLFVV